MTAPAEPHDFRTTRRPRPRRDWRRAVRALRALLDDPDRTSLAFEVNLALDPEAPERGLMRMLSIPEGRRVYEERPSLYAALCDREALTALAEDSFGRAYLAHIDRYGLDPAKLVELGRQYRPPGADDPAVGWMLERQEMTHDLWHVLTGYGADAPGESALLLFSLAQTGGRSNLLLSVGANLRMLREHGPGWIRYAWKAWRRGRRAACLGALPYEELLPRPLAEVREAAGIETPEVAHPGGIARSDAGAA